MLFLKLSCSAGHSIVHDAPNCSWRGLGRVELDHLGRTCVDGSHGCTAGGIERGAPCGAELEYAVIDIEDPPKTTDDAPT